MNSNSGEIVIYQTLDGQTKIDVKMENETVWLTQLQMAELFQTSKQNISLHISNAFKEGELFENAVVKESLTTAANGKNYQTKFYNLSEKVFYRQVLDLYATSADYDPQAESLVSFFKIVQNKIHQPMYMEDRIMEVDDFASRYGQGALTGAGSFSHQQALTKATAEYDKYRKKIALELSPVERDFLDSIKKTLKELQKGEKKGGSEDEV